VDTLQLIEINQNQLLATLSSNNLNFSKSIKIDIVFNDVKNLIRKINHDILNDYVKSGAKKSRLDFLKKQSYDLFNILSFFNFDDYFIKLKKLKKPHFIQLILDFNTNIIPFEILNDGKDFLSDYIIFSRILIDSKESSDQNFSINLNDNFTVIANPSEDEDIKKTIEKELESITDLIDSSFALKGPYKGHNVNKIDFIRLMGSASVFHFSGHYIQKENIVGWKLYNDIFNSSDIKKISKAPNFIFSNSCGDGSLSFFKFINSFLNKGTKVIISTLGQVPSNRASEFSQIFYKYFIKDSHNVGKALFLAREEMIKKYDQSDLFWCFYQVYGSTLVSIKKKLNIRIKKSKKISLIKNLFLGILLVSIGYLIYNNFFMDKSINLISKDIYVNVKSNSDKEKNYIINADALWKTISPNNKHNTVQIHFNKILNNNLELCSILESGIDCKIEQVFIESNQNINRLLTYNNDTLSIFLYDSTNYYTPITIELEKSDDYELFIDINLDISIIDDKQHTYDFNISELLKLDQLKSYVTKSDLNDFKKIYIKKQRNGLGIKFKKTLILNISRKIF